MPFGAGIDDNFPKHSPGSYSNRAKSCKLSQRPHTFLTSMSSKAPSAIQTSGEVSDFKSFQRLEDATQVVPCIFKIDGPTPNDVSWLLCKSRRGTLDLPVAPHHSNATDFYVHPATIVELLALPPRESECAKILGFQALRLSAAGRRNVSQPILFHDPTPVLSQHSGMWVDKTALIQGRDGSRLVDERSAHVIEELTASWNWEKMVEVHNAMVHQALDHPGQKRSTEEPIISHVIPFAVQDSIDPSGSKSYRYLTTQTDVNSLRWLIASSLHAQIDECSRERLQKVFNSELPPHQVHHGFPVRLQGSETEIWVRPHLFTAGSLPESVEPGAWMPVWVGQDELVQGSTKRGGFGTVHLRGLASAVSKLLDQRDQWASERPDETLLGSGDHGT